MNGIISIIKPEGITSYDVIREVKKVAKEKKIGHIGTLDPMATGVLPLFLGKMTKLIPFFNNGSKIYQVKAVLGAESTTLDREGEITAVPIPRSYSLLEIENVIKGFVGEIQQTPPIYSAIKVDGKKLYEYARAGKSVEIKSRNVIIFWIKNISYREPEFCFDVHCSKGTYVRTLAKDIAEKLGTSAYLQSL
ncbi:MAG: tRNA pseudouridine(55) synthase TruB, partial [Proteobacteria bacterium]|nr:tRNA pseudouridine(55) synthase TruB [Pseudomonadota bacterium]